MPGQFHTVASLVLNFRELVPRGQTKLKRPIVLLRASLLGAWTPLFITVHPNSTCCFALHSICAVGKHICLWPAQLVCFTWIYRWVSPVSTSYSPVRQWCLVRRIGHVGIQASACVQSMYLFLLSSSFTSFLRVFFFLLQPFILPYTQFILYVYINVDYLRGRSPPPRTPGEIPVPSFDTSDVFMLYLCLLCNQPQPMRAPVEEWYIGIWRHSLLYPLYCHLLCCFVTV